MSTYHDHFAYSTAVVSSPDRVAERRDSSETAADPPRSKPGCDPFVRSRYGCAPEALSRADAAANINMLAEQLDA